MASTTVLIAVHPAGESLALQSSLADERWVVRAAATGAELKSALASEDVQVVLLGEGLPEVEGCAAVRAMRAAHRAPPVQVILLLSSRESADVGRASTSGADDFLPRPWEPAELVARVQAALVRQGAQAALLREREFYRIAVAEEERLSSLALDQNQSLKEAYEKIRRLNAELEKANSELEQIAAYDSLSGLLNRRTLFHRIGVEIARAVRTTVPLTGLMVDIDHFKAVNDNYGHPCGDLVIREIGQKLQSRLRKYDYAGRYGGEEFFVLLSNSTPEQAGGIAERFRREMEETRFTCNGERFGVTVSIGVSDYRPEESQEVWIERTDRAMYQAKQAGRNQVVIA